MNFERVPKRAVFTLVLAFFCREAEQFDRYMERVCNHVIDVITKFNGTFGLVAWLSADNKVKICSSMNLGIGVDFIPPLLKAFRAHAPRLQEQSTLCYAYAGDCGTYLGPWGLRHGKEGQSRVLEQEGSHQSDS